MNIPRSLIHASMFCLFVVLFFCSFLYSVFRYSLSSPRRIAMLTVVYNSLCSLTEGNKVYVVCFFCEPKQTRFACNLPRSLTYEPKQARFTCNIYFRNVVNS